MTTPVDILIVEDEAIFAMDLEGLLTSLGHRVTGIADSAALAVSLTRQKRPGLVLMDVRLRGSTDGIDAAREIGVRFDTPVVFVSGNSDEATVARASTAMPFGFVIKPVEQHALGAVIETALARYGVYRRIEASKHLLMTTIESFPEGVVVLDREAKVAFLNHAAQVLLGCHAVEAVGRPYDEILRRLDPGKDAFPGQLSVALAGGPVVRLTGAVLARRDGMTSTVHGTLAPIIDEGAVTGAVLLLRAADAP